MPRVSESAKLYVPAERVWETVQDFAGIADWHPAVLACTEDWEGTQRLRRLDVGAAEPVVERQTESDDNAMRYSYVIERGPLPVRDYEASLAVHADDATSCTVAWEGRFEADGVPESEAVAIIQDIYRKGLEHLRFSLAG